MVLDYEKKRQEQLEKSQNDEEFPHRRRNQILAALFATTAMAGYALSSGMLEVMYWMDCESFLFLKYTK